MSELTPTNTQEVMLNNIAKALRGEEITDDVPVSWEHPEAFLKAILDAAKGMNPPLEDGGFKTTTDIIGKYELGEYTEFQVKIGSLDPQTKKGYEIIGLDPSSTNRFINSTPSITENPEIEISLVFLTESNYGDKDGKCFYFSALDAGLEGKHIQFTKTEFVCSANLIDLYDEDDPHEDSSYLPLCATYDDDYGGLIIAESVDMSRVYDRLKHGQPVTVRALSNGTVAHHTLTYWFVAEYDENPYLQMYIYGIDMFVATSNFGYVAPNSDDGDDSGVDDGDHEGIVPPEES